MSKDSAQYKSFPCSHPKCHKVFKSASGRTRHWNAIHRELTPVSEPDPDMQFTMQYHSKLNGMSFTIIYPCFGPHLFSAMPCDEDGQYLPSFTKPTLPLPLDASADNPWNPFEDRLAFEFANFQFTDLQASRSNINRALDLWKAAVVKAGSEEDLPWSNADELYATIDAIQEGDAPWITIPFKYNGPLPKNPPKWMLETYELCTRDSRLLLHQQLSTTEFVDQINYVPYRQFQANGDHVWSNLLSADWSWTQAVWFS